MVVTPISGLFELLGYDWTTMEVGREYLPKVPYEIKSFDMESQTVVWSPIRKLVRKPRSRVVEVTSEAGKAVRVSPNHLFWTKHSRNQESGAWIEAVALIDETFLLLDDSGVWVEYQGALTQDEDEILDIEVEGTHCYFSNGVLSHNTLYGDPTTTSGGKAIPFHSSVRIQLFGGNKIKDAYGDIIGIEVKAKTIKDKVAMPFRRCEFEIIFGQGIREHEQVFEVLKDAGPKEVGDYIVAVGNFNGDAWRKMMVLPKTEFSLAENFDFDSKKNRYKWPNKSEFQKQNMQAKAHYFKSFYLSDFDSLLNDAEAGPYLHDLLEVAMIKTPPTSKGIEDYDLNTESYVEMQALADELGEKLGDLEGI